MNPPTTTQTFMRGVRAALDGVRVALRDPGVRKAYLRVVLGLLLLTLVIDALGLWWLFSFVDPSVAEQAWMGVLFWLLRVVGALLILLIGPMVAILVMNVAFPFFNEPVFMAGLRAQDPERADRVAAGPGMPLAVSAGIAALRLARFVGLTIVFMLIGLVPIIGGIIGMLGQAWLTARTVSWELMDPYFDRLDIRLDGQKEFVARHRDALLGFGFPLWLMLAIPLVGPLLFGWAQGAAGTFLVREVPPHPREFNRG
jgi:CysZ protein